MINKNLITPEIILEHEFKRLKAIKDAKEKDNLLITNKKLNEAVEYFLNSKDSSFLCSCVPDVKLPSYYQTLKSKFGFEDIKKAKEEIIERIRKENNINKNIKLETLW